MNNTFENPFEYKVIYIFEIRDEIHRGLLKIGDTTLKTNKSIDKLAPNSKELNQAALKRIKAYTNTAGIEPYLLHTELAIKSVKDKKGQNQIKPFRDYDVHRVLVNSKIDKKILKGSSSKEWFEVDLKTAIKAIKSVKDNQANLSNEKVDGFTPIIFRPEQQKAIEDTIKNFRKSDRMLWNAKMRFGKTLSALQVVKDMQFKKTIIITHRPVVDDGWYEDFTKIFYDDINYIYGSKNSGYTVDELLMQNKNFVYFASIQDLRGSTVVGGKFDKNDKVFSLDWDFVIVDEAHEGTTTALGNDVIKNIVKENSEHTTKFLALSGTPFNIMNNFDNNIYTWDYIMEQECKNEWDTIHFGDSNPYDELPELKIYTYDLGKLVKSKNYVELEDKAFNFREFFRTWVGDISVDRQTMPSTAEVGDFVHEKDIISFLNLITKEDDESHYPYSNFNYREIFKHSLWLIPGVKEAKALSKLMYKHPVFGSGAFNIVNVAGDGDEEEKSENALTKVREAIESAGNGYTITLSCGRLTTGVTIPEWTGVFMLSGSHSTSAANYLQTIFRVQSPCKKDGKIKRYSYVFDFAPDRTLKMVAEAVALSTKAGKTTGGDKRILGKFLNYCPVISIDGTIMKQYNTNNLLQQLKRAYAERAVKNGFDDTNLYNDELLKLDGVALDDFKELKGIIGTSKAQSKTKDIDLNNQGFTNEEYEEFERINKKPKRERTPEEQAKIDELKERNNNKQSAISILRGISIRMPLLIYGADIPFEDDLTIDKFLDDNIIDTASWEEFMPSGVTKNVFQKFIKYYDQEIFIAAGRKIRNIVKSADELSPIERVKKIADLFSCFKNPDKETVLTPWRVVNMHISDCLGGYDFYDTDHNALIEIPRYVNRGKVTEDTLGNSNAQILEINSKTGLYPLFVAYSIFRSKCSEYKETDMTQELEERLWADTISNNVFVICKTPMAKYITKRTLVGYKDIPINAHYFDDLINMMKNKPKQFAERVLKPSYWKKKGVEKMKFDAIVGNPPYQVMDGGAQASSKPVYHHFVQSAKALNPNYTSFIIPTRWYAGGKGLDEFRDEMLNDVHLSVLHDCLTPEQIFPNTNIRGGVCYFLWDKNYNNQNDLIRVITHENNKIISDTMRPLKLDGVEIFIRDGKSIDIINNIFKSQDTDSMSCIISSLRPFGFRGYFIKDKRFHVDKINIQEPIICYGKGKIVGYIEKAEVKVNVNWIDKWKVYIPRANNIGTELKDDNLNAFIGKPNTICTESYIVVGAEMNLDEYSSKNLVIYLKTKFARYLHSLAKASQDATSKTFKFVPLQDFTAKSDINWSAGISDIDKQLYKKYGLNQEEIDYIEMKIKPM